MRVHRKPLSRAFFKLVELVACRQTIELALPVEDSLFLCESPGGFVQAIRLLFSQKGTVNSDVFTLKSDTNLHDGMRRAFQNEKDVHFLYGRDGTGDVTVPGNFEGNKKYDFITADGAFYIGEGYDRQEEQMARLISAEVDIALARQKEGGTFIIKVFDGMTVETQRLVQRLAKQYEDVYVCKPQSSRVCNGEFYLLCKRFREEGVEGTIDFAGYRGWIIGFQERRSEAIGRALREEEMPGGIGRGRDWCARMCVSMRSLC